MVLKSVLLSVEQVPLESTDETEWVFVLLQLLLILTQLCKFIDHDSPDNLLNDDLNNKEIDKIYQNILDIFNEILLKNRNATPVSIASYTRVRSKSLIEWEHETMIEIGTLRGIFSLREVKVHESC